jgi:hypothetical protein
MSDGASAAGTAGRAAPSLATDAGLNPRRRACVLCGLTEKVMSLHLVTVWRDGQQMRACDNCRRSKTWFCQNRACRREQAGLPVLLGELKVCVDCAADAGADDTADTTGGA